MQGMEKVAIESAREDRAERLVEFLRKIEAGEAFKSKENKIEFIKNLTFDDFKRWLTRINGALRDIPVAKRRLDGGEVALVPDPESAGSFEGILGETKTEYPPRAEDKEELLREMFDLAQKMARENADMEDIALLSSAGINAVHAFEDGNGRTSRLFYFLLGTDYAGSPEQVKFLKKLLGENGRLFVNIDPGKAKWPVQDYLASHDIGIPTDDPNLPRYLNDRIPPEENFKAKIEEKIPSEIRADFESHIIKKDGDYSFFAIYEVLRRKGKLQQIAVPIVIDGNVVRTDLSIVDVVEKMEAEEFKEILDVYWQLKKKGASILMNAIADPESYVIDTGDEGSETRQTIKDVFLEKIDEGYKDSFLEVNSANIGEIWPEKETLPFRTETLPQEKMQELCEIKRQLKEIIEQEKQARESARFDFAQAQRDLQAERERIRREGATSPDGRLSEVPSKEEIGVIYEARKRIYQPILDISKKYFEQVIALLDGARFFTGKFTTRNDHQWATEEEFEETDSIYYMTNTGQTLRLRKYAMVEEGLAGAIEPFMEKAFFENAEGGSTEQPKEGARIVEYVTDEFISAQNEGLGKEFKSAIRRYEKDGSVIYLNPVDGHMHRGYEVRRIIDIPEH
jgi:hypothetical protein